MAPSEEQPHKAHRSGWHKYYETTAPAPQHFLPAAPAAAPVKQAEGAYQKKPPPPPKKKTPLEEFMSLTGMTDAALAEAHLVAAARLNKSLTEAVAHFFEYGQPMQPNPRAANPRGSSMDFQLMEMGFDKDLAEEAARKFSSLEEAAEWCLQQQQQRQQQRQQGEEERRRREELRRQEEQRRLEQQRFEQQRRLEEQRLEQPPPIVYAETPSGYDHSAYTPEQYAKSQAARSSHVGAGANLFNGYQQQPVFAQQKPPPPVPKPALFSDADVGLFMAPKRDAEKLAQIQREKAKLKEDCYDASTPPVVVATNPYGHAAMQFLSMPPTGVMGGAEASRLARARAAKVSHGGKLLKLSGISSGKASRFGNRWQARHFVLSQSTIAYGDLAAEGGLRASTSASHEWGTDEFTGTKKRFSLFGSYVVPEPPERAQGKEFAFAVYRSDADAFVGSSSSHTKASAAAVTAGDEREQLLLLAAEDDKIRSRWICSLLRAAGRGGVLLKVGQDVAAHRLRCCFGDEPLDFEAGAVEGKILVQKIIPSQGLGAVGVKVGDELVCVNGAPVPLLNSTAVRKMLEACPRPLDLEFRRSRETVIARELAAKAVLARGKDDTTEVQRKQRMRESMDVGEALRNDKLLRDQERKQRAMEAQVEAQQVDQALSHSAKSEADQRRVDECLERVLFAVKASADADDAFYARQPDLTKAARGYKIALEALLSVKDDLADPHSAAREALQRKAPSVSLADLFDHINSNGAKAANPVDSLANHLQSLTPLYEHQPSSSSTSSSYDQQYQSEQYEQPQQYHPAEYEQQPQQQQYQAEYEQQPQQQQQYQAEQQQEPQQQQTAYALFAYDPQEDWQLPLQAGTQLIVLSQHDDGWAEVILLDDPQRRQGMVPGSYLQFS